MQSKKGLKSWYQLFSVAPFPASVCVRARLRIASCVCVCVFVWMCVVYTGKLGGHVYISAMVCCCLALLTLSLSHFFSLHLLTLAGPLKALYLTEACKCCTHTHSCHVNTDTQTHRHTTTFILEVQIVVKLRLFFFACFSLFLFIYLFLTGKLCFCSTVGCVAICIIK